MLKKAGVLIIALAFAIGCSGGGKKTTPPSGGAGGGGGGGGGGTQYTNVTISLSASRTSIPADGVSTSQITAVIEADGKPVPDGEKVGFSTTLGVFQESGSNTAEVTTSGGEAHATLVAPTEEGTAVVTVSFAGKSATIQITVTPVYAENPPAEIEVTVEPSEITVYGTATITAKVFDANRKPVKNGTEVNFSTNFPEAKIDPQSATTFNGVASATFTAGSKYGTATIIVTCGDVNTIVNLTILPSKVGSITFVSATPNQIGVRGSSLPEVSEVKFRVVDNLGNNVVDGIKVDFRVVGPNGGEYVDPVSAGTKDGYVTTFLHAGKIAGPVHIIASVTTDSGVISTSSQTIYIGSGKPSGAHFTLSVEADKTNIMGLAYSGLQAKVTAYLADRFGNYVPAKTPVSFFIEGGAITPGALTDQYGTATAIIQTEKPYPRDVSYESPTYIDDYVVYGGKTHNPHDGVVTIIAVTEGEEKFYDKNGNGEYDPDEYFEDLGEPYIDANDNGFYDYGEPYTDVNGNGKYDPGEPFVDKNGNGKYDPGEPYTDQNNNGIYDPPEPFTDLDGNGKWTPPEFYIDYNQNGMYDPPNGEWDSETLIWTSTQILYTSGVYVGLKGSGFYTDSSYSQPVTRVDLENGEFRTMWLRLVDGNLNPLASGTKVSIQIESTGAGTPKYTPTEEKELDGQTTGFLVAIADPDSQTKEPVPVGFYIVVKITYPTGYKVELPPLFGTYR